MKRLMNLLLFFIVSMLLFCGNGRYTGNCCTINIDGNAALKVNTNKLISTNNILNTKNISSPYKKNQYITIMYTDRDYITNYGIYDLNSKKFKPIYSRRKQNYSDFVFDEKNNILYYSDLIDKKYDIYRVDLSKKESSPIKLLGDNYNGDIFNLLNNNLVFRTREKGHRNYTIGTYNLTNNNVIIWNKGEVDSNIYNFCCNSSNNKIYTIERSLKDMDTKKFPNLPTHWIFQYSENGVKEKQLYATKKDIMNISVNNDGSKILFDATSVEDNDTIHKIYLLDLSTSNEKVIIKPGDAFEKDTFTRIKEPKFSPDGKSFYFLGSTTKSSIVEKIQGGPATTSNAIYYYQFSSKKISKIFEVPNTFINEFKN